MVTGKFKGGGRFASFIGPLKKGERNRGVVVVSRARRPRRRQKQKRAQPNMSVRSVIAEKVCSVYDPFCPAAKGAKIPDQNSSTSFPYQTRVGFPIIVDANGAGMYWINWDPATLFNSATVVLGVTTAWFSNTAGTFYTMVGTSVAQWRVVSAGFKFKTTQPWTTATGSLIVSDVSQVFNAADVGQQLGSLQMGRAEMYPVRNADVTFTGGVRGSENNNYNANFGNDPAMNGGILSFFGCAPSVTVGYVEIIVNWEALPVADGGFQSFATPAAKHEPTVMDARARLPSITNTITSATNMAHDATHTINGASKAINEITAMASAISGAYNSPAGKLAMRLLL